MNKKIIISLLLGCMVGMNIYADGQNQKDVTLQGQVCGYVAGNMYNVINPSGTVTRVDLGKYGGRLLDRTPFEITGVMDHDADGAVLKMKSIRYEDPDPFKEYQEALVAQNKPMNRGLTLEQIRDKAFDHALPVSNNPSFYENNVKSLKHDELTQYPLTSVRNMNDKAAGTKVSFIGRAANTIEENKVMDFWDTEGHSIVVKMNGAFVPLGQRCIVYGTLEKSAGTSYVDLQYMQSVDLPG
jgi:uncharacterized protein YdeI (BOF family)